MISFLKKRSRYFTVQVRRFSGGLPQPPTYVTLYARDFNDAAVEACRPHNEGLPYRPLFSNAGAEAVWVEEHRR